MSSATGVWPTKMTASTRPPSAAIVSLVRSVVRTVLAPISTSGSSRMPSTWPKLGGFSASDSRPPVSTESSMGTCTLPSHAVVTRYTPTNQATTATTTPTRSVSPMLAPSSVAAVTGPGCGGTIACIAANAPAAGSAYISTDPPKRFATAKMIGRNTTSPASKKIGRPKSSAATPSASGARFSPKRLTRVSASTCAPPVTSSSRPIITPSPTSSATVPSVLPKAAIEIVGTSATGTPAAIAVPKLTRTSATNACIRSTMMRTSRTATAIAAMSSSVPEP